MRKMKTTWIPLYNFTKMGCDADWQLGVSSWKGIKDALTGSVLKPFETCFWNRRLGNLSVGLQNYLSVRNDPSYATKLEALKLPIDIKV